MVALPAEGRDSGGHGGGPGVLPSAPRTGFFVAGDKAVRIFASDGKKLKEIALEQEPYCLAVGNAEHAFPGRLYVGMRDHVEVYDGQGNREAVWEPARRARPC